MNYKKYQNKNNEDIYVIHFPGTGIENHENIIEDNLNRPIKIDSNLSIISVMNKECWNGSYIVKQCEKNNIFIHNKAINQNNWNNSLKINYILESLSGITTEYVLILDGRDTLIVNDLDRSFIDKFLKYNKPIIYNATPAPYPNAVVELLQDLLNINGKHKYLNAGVCIGERQSLIEFYKKAQMINNSISNNKSEQYIIRIAQKYYPDLVGIDSDINLFRIVHKYDTHVKDSGNIVQLL